jgi:hypothetical protein
MDDLQIAWRPLGELIPYARNPRTHSDTQVAQIAASIREFGWTVPILVDDANGIIAGHGRVLAARQLGLERVPVIEVAHEVLRCHCAPVPGLDGRAGNARRRRPELRKDRRRACGRGGAMHQ